MAKPGSDAARALTGGVDLSKARMTDEEAADRQAMIEVANGLRCGGCGLRISYGSAFLKIDARADSPLQRIACCLREECDYAEHVAATGTPTYTEPIEVTWLDELGVDAPAPRVYVERDARIAADDAAQVEESAAADG